MSTELFDELRRSLGHKVQGIAQVHAFDGAAGSPQIHFVRSGKRDGWTMEPFLDARCDQPDDALVPGRVEQADRATRLVVVAVEFGECIEVHLGFYRAPLAVEVVEAT